MGGAVPQPVQKRLVREANLGVALARQHQRAVGMGAPSELGREPRLPDAGLAAEEYEAAAALTHLGPRVIEHGPDGVPPDERQAPPVAHHGGKGQLDPIRAFDAPSAPSHVRKVLRCSWPPACARRASPINPAGVAKVE
jgi:hypothetical protein